MKNKYGGVDGQTDLLSVGSVLCETGKFDDAEKYVRRLLNQLPPAHPCITDWYHKSLYIKLKTLQPNHSDLAETYNNIEVAY